MSQNFLQYVFSFFFFSLLKKLYFFFRFLKFKRFAKGTMLKNIDKKRKWLVEQPLLGEENDENKLPYAALEKKVGAIEQRSPEAEKKKRVLKDLTSVVVNSVVRTPLGEHFQGKTQKSRSFSDTALKSYHSGGVRQYGERSPIHSGRLGSLATIKESSSRDHEGQVEHDPFLVTSAGSHRLVSPSKQSLALLQGLLSEKQEKIERLERLVSKLEQDLASRDKVIGTLTVDLQQTQEGYMKVEESVNKMRDYYEKIVDEKDRELRDCYECIDALDRRGLEDSPEFEAPANEVTTPLEQISGDSLIPPPPTPHHSRKPHETNTTHARTENVDSVPSSAKDGSVQPDSLEERGSSVFKSPTETVGKLLFSKSDCHPMERPTSILEEQVRRFKAECHLEMALKKLSKLEGELDDEQQNSPFI